MIGCNHGDWLRIPVAAFCSFGFVSGILMIQKAQTVM